MITSVLKAEMRSGSLDMGEMYFDGVHPHLLHGDACEMRLRPAYHPCPARYRLWSGGVGGNEIGVIWRRADVAITTVKMATLMR